MYKHTRFFRTQNLNLSLGVLKLLAVLQAKTFLSFSILSINVYKFLKK